MIFSSPEYFVFFAILLIALALRSSLPYRKTVLLIASYVFYACWDVRFTFLLFGTSLFNHVLAVAIDRSPSERHRKIFLWISVAGNIAVLGYFKYANFFIDSCNILVASFGFHFPGVAVVLPVGISFFTFHAMSYTIDVYRKLLTPHQGFFDFALYMAFFPHMVAGPIVRAGDFLPQLKLPMVLRSEYAWAGTQIFLVGLFKKLIIADSVAPFVDSVFAETWYYSPVTVWLAVLGYAIQIYGDFSGYSDMAIGSARFLGYYFKPNFDMPYAATNITDFWRRWHISLSTWLRDYLYISLGGNRVGPMRTNLNLLITMLLGGLWHGSSWNFVIWGGMHGLALVVHKYWSRWTNGGMKGIVGSTIGGVLTFLFVALLWVPFRTTTLDQTFGVFEKLLFLDTTGARWYYSSIFLSTGWMILGHVIGMQRRPKELVFSTNPFSFRAAFITTTVVLYILMFAPTNTSPFIYFQF